MKLYKIMMIAALLTVSACSSEDIVEDDERVVNVAVPASERPLSYTGTDGELTGYEVEILKAVDEKLDDYVFNIQGTDDSAAEIGLDTGQYDMIAQGLILSPQREESYLIPSESNGPSLMRIYATGHFADEINSLEDLTDKNITPVSPSGGVYNLLVNYNEEHPDNELTFRTTDGGIPTAGRLQEVDSGAYDALIQPSNLGQQEIMDIAGLDLHVSDPIEINPTYFLIHDSSENEQLNHDVGSAIKELREEGTLSELSEEFYGEDILKYETEEGGN
ncbi:transporter substrate-binding domain-containing protein [Corticicoccus populi]|uniref:Transporter substrate-binding domain-containing protein n=1 Tax=Corticicoccus populi TaxID=1812821 RepID=A0ABW5WV75_9STAP